MRWVSLVLLLCSLAACGQTTSEHTVIRLVDVFADANVEGSAAQTASIPRTEWTFVDGDAGWKAGTGVSGLAVRDGRLTGRTTSALPILHVRRTGDLRSHDVLYEVVVRLRASAGANLGVDLSRDEELDLDEVLRQRQEYDWYLTTPVIASDELQTYRISASSGFIPSYPASAIRHVILKPTDVEGAEFEIESVRLVFRKEHLAEIPSGVGWHGLGDVFRETIVSRSPERIELELTVPQKSFFELTLGTLEDAPVTFNVEARRANGESAHLLSRTLTTPNRWEPQYLDLSSLALERVTLTLSVNAAQAGSIGFWGAPAIRSRGALPHPDAPQGVIIVLLDTLRSDHLDMYGYERETAPRLTELAHEGALFADAISQGSWTKVSVPSFLSSTYPTVNGIFDRPHRLPASATTLAEAFRDAGYATWHSSSVPFSGRNSNLHQGVEVLHEVTSFEIPEGQKDVKTARVIADRLLPWIEAHRDVPFFAFFHAMDPHDDLEPYRPYDTLWASPEEGAKHREHVEKVKPHIENPFLRRRGLPTTSELEKADIDPKDFVAHELDWYDGSIRGADAEVARIMERLEELGIADNTLIVFLSDHGEEFLEHGGHFHGRHIYGELVNVPLAFHWPLGVPAGIVRDETVQLLDMAPTVLELAKIPVPKTMQGQSLVPLMSASGETAAFRTRPAISEYKAPPSEPIGRGRVDAFSIVLDGWKLVHNVRAPDGVDVPEFELYDHRADPLNQKNVAEQNPEIVERLAEQLNGWHQWALENRLPTDDTATESMSSDELQKLRSLGYVQ
ncbi:MAG: hypothetical protein BMS9Abin37_0621 [Acidobacteriota bacterium]|nr:MAG: hypothetical protein BMS9Abin37_0621 [Acidobacteriota bacterium]